jgi:hypothetical protein
MKARWRWVLILAAVVGFDGCVALLGVGFVRAQQNAQEAQQVAREAVAARQAGADSATARINEYRAQKARDDKTIEDLRASNDPTARERIVIESREAAITAAEERLEENRRASTTTTTAPQRPQPQPTTTTTTTTSTTTPPRRCVVAAVCLDR